MNPPAPSDDDGENDRRGSRRGDDANTMNWRIGNTERQIQDLWNQKASTESLLHIREKVEEATDEVKGLRRVLVGTAVAWLVGSGGFLVAVLQLAHG